MRQLWLYVLILLMLTLPGMAQNTDLSQLDEVLDTYAASDDTAVVLYVRAGDTEWLGVRGLGNLESGERARPDDLFRIGSITKPLVATTILALVDDNRLALDDPIQQYLPDEIVASVANADTATVRQLLQMTAGIASYTDTDHFDERVQDNPSQWWTPVQVLESVAGLPADFPAGTDYYYSNSNYVLAEIIIETITGLSLAEALESYIFDPAEMDSCYLETEATFAQAIVRGYSDFGDGLDDVTDYNNGVGLGDGGVICTAADLAKFPTTLYNTDRLISEEMLDAMLTPADDDSGGQYGLGIGIDETDYGLEIGHSGATSGFQSNMAYLVDEDITVVILTNNFDVEWLYDMTVDAQAVALGDY